MPKARRQRKRKKRDGEHREELSSGNKKNKQDPTDTEEAKDPDLSLQERIDCLKSEYNAFISEVQNCGSEIPLDPEWLRLNLMIFEDEFGLLKVDIPDNETPLHALCCNEHATLEAVKLVLEFHPDAVSLQADSDGFTPIHCACQNSKISLEVVRYLMDLNPEALRITAQGKTPIALVIENCYRAKPRMDLVNLILRKDPECIQIRVQDPESEHGVTTLLHFACKHIFVTPELLQTLVEHWPESASIPDPGGSVFPLHSILGLPSMGRIITIPYSLVKLLVDNCLGAVRRRMRESEFSPPSLPLYVACREGMSFEVIKCIGDAFPQAYTSLNGFGNSCLHGYCLSGSMDKRVIRHLLSKNHRAIQMENHIGILPLAYAMQKENFDTDIIKYMVQQNPESAQDTSCFHAAAATGSKELFDFFFERFPQGVYSRCTGTERTILHKVAKSEIGVTSEEWLRFIYELYPEAIKETDAEGNLPLHVLCERYYESKSRNGSVQLLLSKFRGGAKHRNRDGCLPLHMMFRDHKDRHADDIRLLLRSYPEAVSVADKEGRLPLHYACQRKGHAKSLDIFVNAHPPSIRVISPKHGSPLHYAAGSYSADLPLIRFLEGKAPDMLDTYIPGKGLPLHCAARDGSPDCFDYLLRKRKLGQSGFHCILHDIFRDKHLADKATIAERIITDYHDHLEDHDLQGATPLHLAAQSDVGMDFIQRLIDETPDKVSLKDNFNAIPLHYALREGDPSNCTEQLLHFFQDGVRIADANGALPIHVACRKGASLNLVQSMAELYPRSIEVADKRGDLPLHKACRSGDVPLVEFLAQRDHSSIRKPNGQGYLPALILCQSSGKQHHLYSELDILGAIWELIRKHPEAILV